MSLDLALGFVQVALGLIPGWGGGQRLLRLVGYSKSLDWLATGRVLSAREMLTHGLANRITPDEEVYSQAVELARSISKNPPEAVRAIKRLLRAGISMPPATAEGIEQAEFPPLWASETHLDAVRSWLQRRGGNQSE